MAASAFALFSAFKLGVGNKAFNLSTDVIKCALITSAWTPSLDVDDVWADISANEITGDGYTAEGATLANQTWSASGGTITLDGDNIQWIAGVSGLSARYAVFYNFTDATKRLICYTLLDTTPADYTVTDGQSIDILLPTTGIFQLT